MPNPTLDSEASVAAARALQEVYLAESPTLTFGDWLLQRVFPNADLLPFEVRDFVGAQRTSDARMYLIGMLRHGSLSMEAALAFLKAQAVTPA